MDIRCKKFNRKLFEIELIKKKEDTQSLTIIKIMCNPVSKLINFL